MRFFCLLLSLLLSPVVLAAEVKPLDNYPTPVEVTKRFNEAVPKMIENTLTQSRYRWLVRIETVFFGFLFLVMLISKNILGKADYYDIVSGVLALGLVAAASEWYLPFLDALLGWSKGLADLMQFGILGNSNPYYPVEFMFNVTGHYVIDISWNPLTWLNHLLELILLGIFSILMILLAVATAVAGIIESFLFIPMALIGLALIPLVLFERFTFLFDGWLRLLFSVIIFSVFLRISVSIGVFGIGIMLGVNDLSDFDGRLFVFGVDNLMPLLGSAAIALGSLWMTLNSYGFATGIVSGTAQGLFKGGLVGQLNQGLRAIKN